MGSFWFTTVRRLPSCEPAVMRLPTVRYSRLANPATVAEFDFRFAHGGLGGIEVGLGAVISGLSVVAVLLADGVFLVQRKNTVQVLAGLRELGLRLFHDAVGLTERRPVGIRLDLEQQLPLLDILPFVISAAHEDA